TSPPTRPPKRRLVPIPSFLKTIFPSTAADNLQTSAPKAAAHSSPSNHTTGYWMPGASIGIIQDFFAWPLEQFFSGNPAAPINSIDASSFNPKSNQYERYLPRLLAVHSDALVYPHLSRVQINTTQGGDLELEIRIE